MTVGADSLIRAANRAQQWARDRPLWLECGFVLILFVVEVADAFASGEPGVARDLDVLGVGLIALAAATLLRRRQNPAASLVALTVVLAGFYFRDYGSFLSVIGLIGFYSTAANSDNRRRAWFVLIGAAVGLTTVASVTLLEGPDGFDYSGGASMTTSICLAMFVGVVMRNREQIFMKAEARAERAEAERLVATDRAVTEERLRIAREMHDVVAHGMSVISVQAAAAQEIAGTDPDRAVELMKSIETTGREALNEMRRMLGVLRNRDAAADGELGARAPQPSLADLEATIAHCREAGLETEFAVIGDERPLSAGLELTVFRIVQEALTNVLKHGGKIATASVELSYQPTALLVTVTDTGRGLIAGFGEPSSGNGLHGMRERVELYDGQLTTGPQLGGGYVVKAVIPLDISSSRLRVVSAASGTAAPVSAESVTTGRAQ